MSGKTQEFKKSILVVDDEPKIVEVVKSYLEHDGYAVFAAYSGGQALELFEERKPGLVVLDLMLPDISGEEICEKIRKRSRVPIIMLTAKVEEENILNGLNIGADDYVIKPFSPRQLIARINAVLRRASEEPAMLSDGMSFNSGDLVVDNVRHVVKKKGNVVNLTPNEYKIFLTMLKYPEKTFTREELISLALGDDFEGYDRTVDTHIKNIRQKIEDEPREPKYLLTVHGIGYRFGGD